MKIAIIGAGLAGLSAGYIMEKEGCDVIIYEASDSIASGASGNGVGMVNPRLSAHKTPEAEFYIDAFQKALQLFESVGQSQDINWNPCGALHLITDEKREKRYRQTVDHWEWGREHMRLVTPSEASEIAGVDIPFEALTLSQSGSVSPQKLCHALAKNLTVERNSKITDLQSVNADAIIIACGMGSAHFAHLPLKAVRGQITEIAPSAATSQLKTNIHFGGYLSATINGKHAIGATFQRWIDHTDVIDEDNDYNINRLNEFLPHLAHGMDEHITGARASMRTTTPDHFPIIGHVRGNIYALTALGSHGITTSIGGAHILRDMILKNPVHHSDEVIKALSPTRF